MPLKFNKMQVTIKETKEQPLLSRKQVTAKVSFTNEATPSNAAIKAEIAKQAKASEDVMVMKGMDTKFGSDIGEMKVYIYNSKEEKNKFELVTKHQKKLVKEAEEAKKKAEEDAKKAAEEAKKKAEEEKAAAETAKAEEKPAEEAKSESPAEAKAEEAKPAEAPAAETAKPEAETAKSEEPKAE